jgi:hypothetical protein
MLQPVGIFGAFVSGGETFQGHFTVYEPDKLHWQDTGSALVPRHSAPMTGSVLKWLRQILHIISVFSG